MQLAVLAFAAVESVGFDILFMVQHYLLYRHRCACASLSGDSLPLAQSRLRCCACAVVESLHRVPSRLLSALVRAFALCRYEQPGNGSGSGDETTPALSGNRCLTRPSAPHANFPAPACWTSFHPSLRDVSLQSQQLRRRVACGGNGSGTHARIARGRCRCPRFTRCVSLVAALQYCTLYSLCCCLLRAASCWCAQASSRSCEKTAKSREFSVCSPWLSLV